MGGFGKMNLLPESASSRMLSLGGDSHRSLVRHRRCSLATVGSIIQICLQPTEKALNTQLIGASQHRESMWHACHRHLKPATDMA